MNTLTADFKRYAIIYFSVHLSALFVNLINLELILNNGYLTDRASFSETRYYLFTKEPSTFKSRGSEFWPLVNFTEKGDFIYNRDGYSERIEHTIFRGIFPDYDFSEFCFYLIVPILYLLYRKYSKQ